MIRFNEAIDQVLAEGAVTHTEEVERSRELFLGILGHDLRNPLAAISGLAEQQLRTKEPERNAQEVRSSADEGTTFIVRLPKTYASSGTAAALAQPGPPARR